MEWRGASPVSVVTLNTGRSGQTVQLVASHRMTLAETVALLEVAAATPAAGVQQVPEGDGRG